MIVKNSVINSWATALTNIAIEEKKVDDFIAQANVIIDILKAQPEFISLLSVHESSDKIRVKIIDNVFTPKDFDNNIINAIKLLVTSDLVFAARDIFKSLRKKLSQYEEIVYGVIWSTTKLDDKTIKTIETKLLTKLNQKIKLVNKIDESILGGIQVVVKGQKFDGSLKGKLLDIKSTILNMNNIEE